MEAFADNIDKLKLCENTIESIELQTDIPKGLLFGIGKAEAIRKINNKYIIWPWTINHAGKSLFFENKEQMKNYVFKENFQLPVLLNVILNLLQAMI